MSDFHFFAPLPADSPWLYVKHPNAALGEVLARTRVSHVVIDSTYEVDAAPDFLALAPDAITHLRIGAPLKDPSPVGALRNLESLSIMGPIDRVSFAALERLSDCYVSDSLSIDALARARSLRGLSLAHVPLADLEPLEGLTQLVRLELEELKLGSLRGLEHLAALRRFVMHAVTIVRPDGDESLVQRFPGADPSFVRRLARRRVVLDLDETESRALVPGTAVAPYAAEPAAGETGMPARPACLLILVDQSGSMADDFGGRPPTEEAPQPRSYGVYLAVHQALRALLNRCMRDGQIQDIWHGGVIGYGARVEPAFRGALAGTLLAPARVLARGWSSGNRHSAAVETQGWPWAATPAPPVWFDPAADGPTPMCRALSLAHDVVSGWAREHPDGFPPVVVNITDGEPSDGDADREMYRLRRVRTADGPVLAFTIVTRSTLPDAAYFPPPHPEFTAPLHAAASPLPPSMRAAAATLGHAVREDARGFVAQAGVKDIIAALDVFTAVPGFGLAAEAERQARTAAAAPTPAATTPSVAELAPPQAATASTSAETRWFRLREGTSDKFWQVSVDGVRLTVHFGRTGTAGQFQEKELASPEAARAAANKLIGEKTRKGYVEVSATAEPMTPERFWDLIERSRRGGGGGGDCEAQADRLAKLLRACDEQAILDFDRLYAERVAEAYRWDLWGAAFVINQGCSDDGFEYFLGWLIAQGREYYEAALADPEQAGRRAKPGDMVECESIAYAAPQAYEQRTGRDDFYDRRTKVPRDAPNGDEWAEEELPALFPNLARRFGGGGGA